VPIRNLPDRASLAYLKKVAKERLRALRALDPAARLADTHLIVAREYGFSSWRALKAEIDRRHASRATEFFRACAAGDIDRLLELLKDEAGLVRERDSEGRAGLHLAVRHASALRVLLEHGADPDVRDTGDNATALHVAAANGCVDSVRLLLEAGADVQGSGDLHKGDVIGWAARPGNELVVQLLLGRGARHHIFSAMALRDLDLVRRLVEHDPGCLSRRRSRFENGQTALHAACAPPDGLGWLSGRPDRAMLALLIELGAELEAKDDKGRTPMALAMLRGDREAMHLLKAAGAKEPEQLSGDRFSEEMSAMAGSITKSTPMCFVRDMRATVRWYESIGFTVADRYEDGGELMFASVSLGGGGLTLSPGGDPGPRGVSLWFFTERVEELYRLLKDRQLRVAEATLSGRPDAGPDVPFEEDLYEPFYGGRQFSIRDNNGLTLIFWQRS
jgi:ankyrin repeat protein/catechol 2,3-dioxygenase-like lactoylglutathione lyase family enzyme